MWEALASDGDLDLLSLNNQRHTAFRPHFQAQSYSLSDIGQRFFTTRSLADTARDRRTFSDPDAILITIQCSQKFHAWHFTSRSSRSNWIQKKKRLDDRLPWIEACETHKGDLRARETREAREKFKRRFKSDDNVLIFVAFCFCEMLSWWYRSRRYSSLGGSPLYRAGSSRLLLRY
jgi:hypothetical protein